MATTNIELDIENITGVSDANDQFIIGAQKFVVSSVPKNLLKWTGTETTSGTHGGDASPVAITLPVGTDNLLSVRRGDYRAEEVSVQEAAFLESSSGSLKIPTSIYPKYFLKSGNTVNVKPDPDGSTTAHATFVDFSKLDDDCDLRNAVVMHACSKEFTKLSSDVIPSWSDVTAPITPSAPNFGNDITINAVSPAIPTISTISYTDATNSDASSSSISAITVNSVSKADISGNAPTYTKPSLTTRVSFDTFFDGATNSFGDNDPGVFNIISIAPAVPSINTVSYTDATNADASASAISTATATAPNIIDVSGNAPAYTKPATSINIAAPVVPTISTISFTDPGLSLTAVEPSKVTLTTVNYAGPTSSSVSSLTPPLYSAPTLQSFTSFEDFWEAEEDSNPFGDSDPGLFTIRAVPPAPLASPRIIYSDAAVGDAVSVAQDSIAAAVDSITAGPTDAAGTTDTDAPSDASGDSGSAYTKPTVAGDGDELTDVSILGTDNTIDVHADQLEVDQWWTTLAHLIEDEEDTELANAQIDKIKAYIGAFQAEVQSASAAMQATIEDAKNSTQASIANASNDVSTNNTSMQTLVQASIANAGNDVQASVSKMQQSTSAATQKMVQSTTAAVQKMQLSSNINVTNKAKDLEALISDYTLAIQKNQSDVAIYQQDITKEVQEYAQKMSRYQLELNTAYTAWVETQSDGIKRYQAELQNSQADFGAKQTIFQTDLQVALTNATETNKVELQKASEEAKDAIENNNAAINKYQSESQNYTANIQKAIQSYQSELQSSTQEMQSLIQDNESKLNKYKSELQSYEAQVQTELAIIQVNVQNELNEFNKETAIYQTEFQEAVTKSNADLEVAISNANLLAQELRQESQQSTEMDKFNKSQDQVLELSNKAKQMEDLIADNNSKLQKYGSELTLYQANIGSEVQEHTQKLDRYKSEIGTTLQAWIKTESDTLQQYQLDIQNELNEFNKENSIYQSNIQAELAKHQSDLQKALTQAQINAQDAQQEASLTTDVDKFNKAQDQALSLANAAKQIEDVIADNGNKLQKHSSELQVYQADVNKEIQAYTTTLSKDVQEYQSKLGVYTADLQKYQAKVASETQKTALNSQKAQLYQAESQKYYQWAVTEIQSYIQNNSKMIGMTMAAQSAQQRR